MVEDWMGSDSVWNILHNRMINAINKWIFDIEQRNALSSVGFGRHRNDSSHLFGGVENKVLQLNIQDNDLKAPSH